MKAPPFAYQRAESLSAACALLDTHGGNARILAGGQSLVPMMAFRLARPKHLIDINGVAEFARIAVGGSKLIIGPTARHAAFEQPVEGGVLGRLLARVARHIGHAPIRSRGTFCGSLANADPASEWCMTAATLDAELRLASVRGVRSMRAADYFQGVMQTAMERDEVLVEVRLPLLPGDTLFGFHESCRRAGDFALAAALALFRIVDGRIAEPRLGLAGAEAAPRRIAEAEAVLAGAEPSERVFAAAAEAASAAVDPLTDAQTDADFRREIVRATVLRALRDCGA